MNTNDKYKDILKGKLNYFDLIPTEKHWYLHLKENRSNSIKDKVVPVLELGIRVWSKGILYTVTKRKGWDIELTKTDEDLKVVSEEKIFVDEIKEVNYSLNYDKRKLTFILDDPTEEEISRVLEVLKNEAVALNEERSKGVNTLYFKKDTVGEKIHEVLQNYKFNRLAHSYVSSEPYGTILRHIIIKNKKEGTEINWDDFPRDKRQEFIDLPYLTNVDYVNDYFEVRYIYMKTSIKEYIL